MSGEPITLRIIVDEPKVLRQLVETVTPTLRASRINVIGATVSVSRTSRDLMEEMEALERQ